MIRLDFLEKLETYQLFVCAYDNQPEIVSWQSINFEIRIKQMNITVTKSKQDHKNSEVWVGFNMRC